VTAGTLRSTDCVKYRAGSLSLPIYAAAVLAEPAVDFDAGVEIHLVPHLGHGVHSVAKLVHGAAEIILVGRGPTPLGRNRGRTLVLRM
jgi:hypothetical protein